MSNTLQTLNIKMFDTCGFSRDLNNSFKIWKNEDPSTNLGWLIILPDQNISVKLFDEYDEEAKNEITQNILADFEQFKNTPYYHSGRLADLSSYAPEHLKMEYCQILEGIILERSLYRTGDEKRGQQEFARALEWLQSTDFFTAPASTQYHEAFPGGLCLHSLKVYNAILELKNVPSFRTIPYRECGLVALIHDWCKIGLYESYLRNVKNEDTGKWEQITAYRRGEPKYPFGHGEASMYLSGKFFWMSMEEAAAVRWHMGKWYTPDEEDNALSFATRKYPIVGMLQFADQMSLKEYW